MIIYAYSETSLIRYSIIPIVQLYEGKGRKFYSVTSTKKNLSRFVYSKDIGEKYLEVFILCSYK